MANQITFVGNLVRDPDLRTSAAGKSRATFTVAVNEGERGTDSERTHFVNCTAFGTLGENVVDSLSKGMRVVVVGRLDTYGKAVEIDGEEKTLTMVSFIVSAVGPDLRWATAEVSKVETKRAEETPAAKPAAKKTAAKKVTAKKQAVSDDDDF